MRFRLKAFGLHLLGSASALTLVLGSLYFGWYRWPGWYLASALYIVAIMVLVDIVLGPTMTLIIANPRKPDRELVRDVTMIVAVQLTALIYGAVTLWSGRPLYYTFSADHLDFVQASDLARGEIALARRQNPSLAPYWYSLPRWVSAPLPDDPRERGKSAESNAGGTPKVSYMPRYFQPWEQGLPMLRGQLRRLDDIGYMSKAQKRVLRARMSRRGLAPDERNALVIWGGAHHLLVVFDPITLRIRAILNPDL